MNAVQALLGGGFFLAGSTSKSASRKDIAPSLFNKASLVSGPISICPFLIWLSAYWLMPSSLAACASLVSSNSVFIASILAIHLFILGLTN